MIRFAAVLTLLALVLAGCFSGSGGVEGGVEGSEGTESRLRVGLSFPPTSGLSPYGNEATLATRLGVTEPLVTLAAGGPEPALATAWTQLSPTSWRFTLRPGVAFHDGSPLTPEAVVNSLTRAAAATPAPRALASLAEGRAPLTARPDGPDAVVVTTPVPDPVLPQRLASPELVVLAAGAYADPTRPSPVRAGTGPFVLTRVDGSTGAALDANPSSWRGPVAAPGIDARFLTDGAARTNALRAGELDVAEAIPASQVASITAPQRVVGVPLPRSVAVYLDQRSPVFADPGLRAAARAAIAPIDVAGTIYEGRADPAGGLFGPATPWAVAPGARPAHADTPPTPPTGQRIRLATYSDRAELPEIAAADADALRRAGFTVDVTVLESSAFEAQLGTGTFDAVIVSRSQQLDTGDPIGYLTSDFSCAGGYNWAGYCDPATDAVLATAAQTSDVEARRRAALEVEARVLAADAVVPHVTERARIGVGAGVTGVAEDPNEQVLVTQETRRG
ncbi:ABC transporter substrate-binding protein [Actinomycetospora cinnamomea]|uniref:Peptide/nickel transport system substrate-binding protein n=1 Tax=Actinomycetospora cinnamomea TaxID=663609 RepID=A0A2U1FM93_9PSEU|nr:ABC transporter substrate-binding protein [Actinomycetospora cinnamomea]PVZ13287.1 peptide/nickel transport system substrate-binding protein [Actinomycetospora cinnamomea]